MSLKVWLPLNGDLYNQGTSNITITNNGATVNTNGKIGSCYSFDGTDDYLQFSNFNPSGWPEISISAWVYPTATFDHLFLFRGSGAHRFKVNSSGVVFRDTNNTGTQRTIALGQIIPTDIWTHITCVYKCGEIWIYQNGIQTAHSSTYYNATSTLLNDLNEYRIARAQSSSSNSYYTGKINDFRIYDHALSAAEVREISQGLVLHYKLNGLQGNFGNKNILTNSSGQLGTSAGWSGLVTASTMNGEPMLITKRTDTTSTSRTFCHHGDLKSLITDWDAGDYYTISGWYYVPSSETQQTGGNLFIRWQYTNTSGTVTTTDHGFTTSTTTQDQWIRFKYTAQVPTGHDSSQSANFYLSAFAAQKVATVYWKKVKLEKGDIDTLWCPADSELTIDRTHIQDSSGYGHNGTINSMPTISYETIRYSASTSFDGVDDCITVPYNAICPENIFTINLWFKKDALGSKNYETLFGGPSGFEMDTRAGSATTLSLYMASTRSTKRNLVTELSLCNWYMVTMTRDGTKEKYYINGIYQSEIDAKSMPTGTYRIGAWNSNTGQNYYGLISDFRIYCTALSADDIKQLYQVSAKVDNLGGLHTFELNENNTGRELLAIPLTQPYNNHTANYSGYDTNGEITLTGNSSIGSNYIKINPTGHTYYYDIDVSTDNGNVFYIGFERYDANKTARSNNACIYLSGLAGSSEARTHKHYHGTVNLATDGVNPTDTIALRILNDWSGANGRKATIHKISLREVSTISNSKINKKGQVIVDEFIELDGNCRVQKNGSIEANEFIEL